MYFYIFLILTNLKLKVLPLFVSSEEKTYKNLRKKIKWSNFKIHFETFYANNNSMLIKIIKIWKYVKYRIFKEKIKKILEMKFIINEIILVLFLFITYSN